MMSDDDLLICLELCAWLRIDGHQVGFSVSYIEYNHVMSSFSLHSSLAAHPSLLNPHQAQYDKAWHDMSGHVNQHSPFVRIHIRTCTN